MSTLFAARLKKIRPNTILNTIVVDTIIKSCNKASGSSLPECVPPTKIPFPAERQCDVAIILHSEAMDASVCHTTNYFSVLFLTINIRTFPMSLLS